MLKSIISCIAIISVLIEPRCTNADLVNIRDIQDTEGFRATNTIAVKQAIRQNTDVNISQANISKPSNHSQEFPEQDALTTFVAENSVQLGDAKDTSGSRVRKEDDSGISGIDWESDSDEARFQRFLYTHQHPAKCEPSRMLKWGQRAGFGSQLQVWRNTFTRAIVNNKILGSGFKSVYANPEHCPSRDIETCFLYPISNCTTNKESSETFTVGINNTSCALPRMSKLRSLVKLQHQHSRLWYNAQFAKYLLRRRPHVNQYRMALLNQANIDPKELESVLAIHIRHGDVGKIDSRKRIPVSQYARVAQDFVAWGGFHTILVASDGATISRSFSKAFDSSGPSKVCGGSQSETNHDDCVRIAIIGGDLFELKSGKKGMAYNQLLKLRAASTSKAKRASKKKKKNITPKKESGNDVQSGEGILQVQTSEKPLVKDEAAALLAQLLIMSEAGAFVGTINSNFGRTVWELASGSTGSTEVNAIPKTLYDMEARPYSGCQYEKSLPLGGGNKMYPFE